MQIELHIVNFIIYFVLNFVREIVWKDPKIKLWNFDFFSITNLYNYVVSQQIYYRLGIIFRNINYIVYLTIIIFIKEFSIAKSNMQIFHLIREKLAVYRWKISNFLLIVIISWLDLLILKPKDLHVLNLWNVINFINFL